MIYALIGIIAPTVSLNVEIIKEGHQVKVSLTNHGRTPVRSYLPSTTTLEYQIVSPAGVEWRLNPGLAVRKKYSVHRHFFRNIFPGAPVSELIVASNIFSQIRPGDYGALLYYNDILVNDWAERHLWRERSLVGKTKPIMLKLKISQSHVATIVGIVRNRVK